MEAPWNVIYLEGLPGLGKTTTAVNLAAAVDPVVLVAENNPSPASYSYVQGLDAANSALWYLETERARSSYTIALAHAEPGRTVVCDKGALATLAYTYATCHIGLHPWSLYDQIRDAFRTHSRSHLTSSAAVVVFTGSADLSLRRRKTNNELRSLWFDERFLHAYARFFTDKAAELTTGPMTCVDVTIDQADVMTRVAALASLPVARAPQHEPQSPALPLPFRRYAENTTEEILGRPIGRSFIQLGNLAQAFERHLLFQNSHGNVHLQQEHWATISRPE
ncbi:MAG: ATP-binding protein [Pseudonocardiaceae bacterium]